MLGRKLGMFRRRVCRDATFKNASLSDEAKQSSIKRKGPVDKKLFYTTDDHYLKYVKA